MAASQDPLAPVLTTQTQRELSRVGAVVESEHQAFDLWQQLTPEERSYLGDDFLKAYGKYGTVGMWRRLHAVSCNRAVIEIAMALGLIRDGQAKRLLRELSRVEPQTMAVAEVLSRREQQFLVGLLQLRATDPGTKSTTSEVVKAIHGSYADPATFKDVVYRLGKIGLIDTQSVGGGGCWLTPKGRERADRLTVSLGVR